MNWIEIGNFGANLWAGSVPANNPLHEALPSPLNEAVTELRRRGHSVGPSEGIPGLFTVSGVGELTIGQVIDIAGR